MMCNLFAKQYTDSSVDCKLLFQKMDGVFNKHSPHLNITNGNPKELGNAASDEGNLNNT